MSPAGRGAPGRAGVREGKAPLWGRERQNKGADRKAPKRGQRASAAANFTDQSTGGKRDARRGWSEIQRDHTSSTIDPPVHLPQVGVSSVSPGPEDVDNEFVPWELF